MLIFLTGDLSIDYRVHKTAISLAKFGFQVQCISRWKKGYGYSQHIEYNSQLIKTVFKNGPLFYAEYNIKVFFYLLFHRCDIILSIDLDTLAGCWAGSLFGKRKLIFDSHEYFPEVPELQHRKWVKNIWLAIEGFLVPKVDRAYTVCQSIADLYNNKYRKEFGVVRNLPLANRLVEDEKVLNDKRFKILYQGAVNLGRGIFETLEAIKNIDNVVFVIIGDGDEMQQVKDFVASNKLDDRVNIIGKIPFSKLSGYTQSADIGMCLLENIGLNYYYSLPNRIFDFALAGIPVVASNFPEIAKIVGIEKTGVLVNDLKPSTIAGAIEMLMNDNELYLQLSENANRASLKLTWENEESVLYSVFSNI